MKGWKGVAAFTALAFALGMLAPAATAQVTASPETVTVSLPQGQRITIPLTLSNAGDQDQPVALSLAPADADPGDGTEPGDLLFTSEETCCDLLGLAMVPPSSPGADDARLFVVRGDDDTYEFTPDLDFAGDFEHPSTAFLARTTGIAYRSPASGGGEGALWWLDVQVSDGEVTQAKFLEGSLAGTSTGRRLDAPYDPDDGICDQPSGRPGYLAFDANGYSGDGDSGDGNEDAGHFYNLDVLNDTIWASDTLGVVAEGYPVQMTDYSRVPQPPNNPEGCLINSGLDAHTLTVEANAPAEPLLEVVTGYPFVHPQNRAYAAVVLDRQPGREGRNRGAETPLFDLPTPDGFGNVLSVRGIVRSRLEPSVLYLSVLTGFAGDVRYWLYAVRAAPLTPVWLRAEAVLDTVQAQAQTEALLKLDATGLAVGVYEGVVSVRLENGIGPVVAEVPVTLTVTEGTSAEDGAEPEAEMRLSVWPNPSRSHAQVSLTMVSAADVRVSVYDVLGREVTVLFDGPLAVGERSFRFDMTALPAGFYLVRADGGGVRLTERLTLLR